MKPLTFVIRPEESADGWPVARNAMRQACELARESGKAVRVRIDEYKKPKTDPQRNTIFMWHTEVASQLNERCRMAGHGVTWNKEAVHDLIFKPRFMPKKQFTMPDGETKTLAVGLSDPEATRGIVSDAMEHYLSWIYQQGMEVTIPVDPEIEAMCRRCA